LMDLTLDGLLDAEAQELLIGLKSRLYDTSKKVLNLHCVELSKGRIDPKRKEHAEYLDNICQQFVSQMTTQIGVEVEKEEEEYDWLVEEVRQHSTMASELSKGVNGRDGLLGKISVTLWESTTANHGLLVIHGAAGMGKTTLVCKLAQEMQGVLEAKVVLVIRLLAANHPHRPNINHVLHSICLQVCLACGLAPPSLLSVSSHLELQHFFKTMLEDVSQQGQTLLVILDSLEQLADEHQAHKLHWLPTDIPPNVHLLVSMDTTSEAFANLRLKLGAAGCLFEVDHLSRDEGEQIIESYLKAFQRTLTRQQKEAVLQNFKATGSPLHLKLLLSTAKRWTSFTPPSDLLLGSSIQEVMSSRLLKLEDKHGKKLVGGALGYIVSARRGLLEAELRDVMSLDDDIICEVYRYSLPPTPSLIRLPPILWARLKWDLNDQLEERWTDGVAVIAFRSRLLSEIVKARYLTPERRGRTHRILAEYFLGCWSGKLKPASLPGLTLLLSDRKVPPQPLWFVAGLANVRKLQELPHHLLHAGLWEELRQEVVGSAEWLYCKSRVCGVSSLISDLDQCFRYMDCSETRLVHDALVLMKPSLDVLSGHMDQSLFYSELLARLSSLSSTFKSVIGQICSQCDDWLQSCLEPVLIPKSSFLQQPGGALRCVSLFSGVLCLDISVALQLLVTGSADGMVAVWDLSDRQLVHALQGPTGESKLLCGEDLKLSTHCLSLAADGSLKRWSLKSGQELHCIQEAGPAGSAPSSVQLQVSELFVYTWTWTQVGSWPSLISQISSSFMTLIQFLLLWVFLPGLPLIQPVYAAGSLSERLAVSAEVSCLELAQHKRLLLCGLASGTVLIYPLTLPQETLCIPPPESLSPVLCLAVSSQEKHLAVAYKDSVCLFEITTRDNFPTVEGPLGRAMLSVLQSPLSSMALLPDRRLLYGTDCGKVKLHDFSTTASSDLQPHRSRVTCVASSNWGTHALVGSQDATLMFPLLWFPDQGLFFEGVLCASFSESDQFVFTGSQDRTIKVWDVASGNLLYVQYVYSPVVRMVTFRNGFVALSLEGSVIQEAFRCPEHIDPAYNPLRNIRAQYRVTSREKHSDGQQSCMSDLQDFNPAQINLNLISMLRTKPSSSCILL
uniref:NACHT and WD repeat domain containing 1 n=1 Tax=Cyprinodon variegatus TaxID=28743 RepID=A0A3Q2E3W5_CYPVA